MTWKLIPGATTLDDGDLREFDADGVRILLIRRGAEFFAFPPLCPHQEEELEISGICDGDILTCSKHLWQWNIRTGEEMGEAERPLLKYRTRLDDGEVQIFIEHELRYSHHS